MAIRLEMKSFYILFSLITFSSYSQHVKMEVLEYPKYFSEAKYATYHFVQSSYSASRPYTLIILSLDDFLNIYPKIKIKYEKKQGFTDVYLLGIENLNSDNLTNKDIQIIENFHKEINNYRQCNNLEYLNEAYFESHKHFYKNEKGFGKFLSY